MIAIGASTRNTRARLRSASATTPTEQHDRETEASENVRTLPSNERFGRLPDVEQRDARRCRQLAQRIDARYAAERDERRTPGAARPKQRIYARPEPGRAELLDRERRERTSCRHVGDERLEHVVAKRHGGIRLVERATQRLGVRQPSLTPPLHGLGRQIARGVIEMRDGAAVDEPLQVLVQRLEPFERGVVVRSIDNEHVAKIRGAKLLAELAIGSRASRPAPALGP